VVNVGQRDESGGGQVAQAPLLAGALRPGDMQQGGELALGEVVVFAHIANAAVVCHKMSS